MTLPEFSIQGKQALVVGAGRGIGRWTSLVLAEAGADVAVVSLTPEGTNRVVRELREAGHAAFGVHGDATQGQDMERIARRVLGQFPSLDILVNCVGDAIHRPVVPPPGTVGEGMNEADWHRIIDVNLTTVFLGCKAFGSHFLGQRHGSIINISGTAGLRGEANLTAYSASKGAITQFTQALAKEWAPFTVRVNAIAPGSFPDPDQVSPETLREREEWARKRVPLGRLGGWRDVGLLAVFLASDASAYVTGQTWVVDGGMSI